MQSDAFRTAGGDAVPAVTADEMREVDRVAVEEFGLALLSMMENAGRTLSWHVRDVSGASDDPVTVVAGSGGNGGGGLAAARHLHNREVPVTVVLDRSPGEFEGAAGRQLAVLREMGVDVRVGADDVAASPGTVVDAVIGYGLDGPVRGTAGELIGAINDRPGAVVSLDVPSGRDATTGAVLGAAVDPDRVLTLAVPKTGLDPSWGTIVLADIGIPGAVYRRMGVEYSSPFGDEYWIELIGKE